MPEPIPIIGGTGALGWGLALRLASAGQPVVIGSRSAERAEEAVGRLLEAVPDAEVEGLVNDEAARRGPIVFLTVPFRAQSENLNNLREALGARADPGRLHRAHAPRPWAARRPARSASGRGRRPSRRRRWSPTG